jgi:hypothetical protein
MPTGTTLLSSSAQMGWMSAMHVARLAAAIAFPQILHGFERIVVLDDPLRWKVQGITRGLEGLRVSVVPA